jgi:membrane associated rhomboid family serine protease
LPLSDRDYMRNPPPSSRSSRRYRFNFGFNLDALWVLIGLNFLIFLITIVWGRGMLYIDGVVRPVYKMHYYLGLIPAVFPSRVWTLLTAMFVHADFWHILFNMIALFFFGRVLKQFVGQSRFLLVYLVGGIVGNIVFLLLNLHSAVTLVGASGAVYAIAGALVLMVPTMRVLFWGIIPMPLWVFVVVFLGILSLPNIVGSNVAWQAHFGGLAAGLVAGFFFRRKMLPLIYYR